MESLSKPFPNKWHQNTDVPKEATHMWDCPVLTGLAHRCGQQPKNNSTCKAPDSHSVTVKTAIYQKSHMRKARKLQKVLWDWRQRDWEIMTTLKGKNSLKKNLKGYKSWITRRSSGSGTQLLVILRSAGHVLKDVQWYFEIQAAEQFDLHPVQSRGLVMSDEVAVAPLY